jgi:hypothetical protein
MCRVLRTAFSSRIQAFLEDHETDGFVVGMRSEQQQPSKKRPGTSPGQFATAGFRLFPAGVFSTE